MRISKVTTKAGDKGKTHLGSGEKVSKDHPRIRCLGAIDELNAHVGLARNAAPPGFAADLIAIQNALFNLGGELSLPANPPQLLKAGDLKFIEDKSAVMNRALPPLKEFILPGGDEFSARLHVARAVCRRAEIEAIALGKKEAIPQLAISYLNRLSDYFFVLARYHLHLLGENENQWEPPV